MLHLVVVTDDGDELYRELVSPAHLETEHSKAQLVERVSWVIEGASSLRHSDDPKK